ncbi:uncharacterized protein [Dermacentor andersoni]|uniref:uncharacterized protein isoform X3 n=1 Tax=Dermacentor andersoni TaxID=34620 RepID=UPI003B3A4104
MPGRHLVLSVGMANPFVFYAPQVAVLALGNQASTSACAASTTLVGVDHDAGMQSSTCGECGIMDRQSFPCVASLGIASTTGTSSHMPHRIAIKAPDELCFPSGRGGSNSGNMLNSPFCFMLQVVVLTLGNQASTSACAASTMLVGVDHDAGVHSSTPGECGIMDQQSFPYVTSLGITSTTVTSSHMPYQTAIKAPDELCFTSGRGGSNPGNMLSSPFCFMLQILPLIGLFPVRAWNPFDGACTTPFLAENSAFASCGDLLFSSSAHAGNVSEIIAPDLFTKPTASTHASPCEAGVAELRGLGGPKQIGEGAIKAVLGIRGHWLVLCEKEALLGRGRGPLLALGPLQAAALGPTRALLLHLNGSMQELQLDDCRLSPVPVAGRVCHVSCGHDHQLALTVNGQLLSWGHGGRGQLGHGSLDSEHSPRLLEPLAGVALVGATAGGWHSAALSEAGDLYLWGWNRDGQLATDPRQTPLSTLPFLLDTLLEVRAVSLGSRHTAALAGNGSAWAWGSNIYGQLGPSADGMTQSAKPVEVAAEDAVAVDCSPWATLVLSRTSIKL